MTAKDIESSVSHLDNTIPLSKQETWRWAPVLDHSTPSEVPVMESSQVKYKPAVKIENVRREKENKPHILKSHNRNSTITYNAYNELQVSKKIQHSYRVDKPYTFYKYSLKRDPVDVNINPYCSQLSFSSSSISVDSDLGMHNYRVLVGRPEGKIPLERSRRRWEDTIKIDLRELGYDGRDWINLAQDRDRWWAYVRAAMNLRVLLKLFVNGWSVATTEWNRDYVVKKGYGIEKWKWFVVLYNRCYPNIRLEKPREIRQDNWLLSSNSRFTQYEEAVATNILCNLPKRDSKPRPSEAYDHE
ncbi:hypothetical protein ANN_12010 [Periplaneta americana]|uniref:Uncharacterized protein n=1 Tax=Periplaneta americana TaxID=6978 RepID=A0ABQ8T835_PERAM|nr:hypothetical protein ANN_12010 [Periplaneta americana]